MFMLNWNWVHWEKILVKVLMGELHHVVFDPFWWHFFLLAFLFIIKVEILKYFVFGMFGFLELARIWVLSDLLYFRRNITCVFVIFLFDISWLEGWWHLFLHHYLTRLWRICFTLLAELLSNLKLFWLLLYGRFLFLFLDCICSFLNFELIHLDNIFSVVRDFKALKELRVLYNLLISQGKFQPIDTIFVIELICNIKLAWPLLYFYVSDIAHHINL